MKSNSSTVLSLKKPSLTGSLTFFFGISIAMLVPTTSWSMDLMLALRDATRQDSQLAAGPILISANRECFGELWAAMV